MDDVTNEKESKQGELLGDFIKSYSPNETAQLLDMKLPTLRKYSAMMEERGYLVERNSQNHRYYKDADIIALRRIIKASKSGISLDEAVRNTVILSGHISSTNDINNADTNNNDSIVELKEMIHEQGEQIERQSDLIKEMAQMMNEQQTYIDKRMNERDGALMQAMNEITESKKEIAERKNGKGILSKLFNR